MLIFSFLFGPPLYIKYSLAMSYISFVPELWKRKLYINVYSMGNKHNELESFVQVLGYDLFGNHRDAVGWLPWLNCCNVAVQAFEKRQEAGWEYEERESPFKRESVWSTWSSAWGGMPTKSLWVRIKERTGKGDIIVVVCHRLLDHKWADLSIYLQARPTSCL